MSTATAVAIATVVKSIVVNSFLATVKIATGALGNSYALIADGIESINDIVASVVVMVSLKMSSKPADDDHPFGHGKAEQLGALFSALSLLAAGGLIAWQSAHNLFSRHESPAWFTLPILLLVIVTKEILSRYALRKSEETSSAALKGDAWHHRSDAITSAAAFIGIVVALIGGPDYAKADDVAALVGCVVIAYNGGKLLRQALHENMDGAPEREVVEGVRAVAAGVAGVLLVEKIRMKKIGLGYFVELHLHVYRELNVEEGHRIAHAAKIAISEAFPHIRDIATHVEPFRAPVPEQSLERSAAGAARG